MSLMLRFAVRSAGDNLSPNVRWGKLQLTHKLKLKCFLINSIERCHQDISWTFPVAGWPFSSSGKDWDYFTEVTEWIEITFLCVPCNSRDTDENTVKNIKLMMAMYFWKAGRNNSPSILMFGFLCATFQLNKKLYTLIWMSEQVPALWQPFKKLTTKDFLLEL